MNKAIRTPPVPTPTATVNGQIIEVERELDKILASAAFRSSLHLTRFLRFIIAASLDGRSDRIKAYTIAVEALGRSPSFDPQTDPIVRVEAGRLRAALARYYAGDGRSDTLVIDVPRGGYVPTFRLRGVTQAITGKAGTPNTPEGSFSAFAAEAQKLGELCVACQEWRTARRRQIEALEAEIAIAAQTLKQLRVLLTGDFTRRATEPLFRGASAPAATSDVQPMSGLDMAIESNTQRGIATGTEPALRRPRRTRASVAS